MLTSWLSSWLCHICPGPIPGCAHRPVKPPSGRFGRPRFGTAEFARGFAGRVQMLLPQPRQLLGERRDVEEMPREVLQ